MPFGGVAPERRSASRPAPRFHQMLMSPSSGIPRAAHTASEPATRATRQRLRSNATTDPRRPRCGASRHGSRLPVVASRCIRNITTSDATFNTSATATVIRTASCRHAGRGTWCRRTRGVRLRRCRRAVEQQTPIGRGSRPACDRSRRHPEAGRLRRARRPTPWSSDPRPLPVHPPPRFPNRDTHTHLRQHPQNDNAGGFAVPLGGAVVREPPTALTFTGRGYGSTQQGRATPRPARPSPDTSGRSSTAPRTAEVPPLCSIPSLSSMGLVHAAVDDPCRDGHPA